MTPLPHFGICTPKNRYTVPTNRQTDEQKGAIMTLLGLAIGLTLVIIGETAHYFYRRKLDREYREKLERLCRKDNH